MLREDVVDKVIKRDALTLFNVRNPISMEKLFLYLCEIKYRNSPSVPASDAIVERSKEDIKITNAFVLTKSLTDYGVTQHETLIPIFKIPALVFIYMCSEEPRQWVRVEKCRYC